MDIDRLREYIELSRELNFTASAKKLHLSQSALSNHIQALEQEVGCLLIERSSGSVDRLTMAGQRMLEMSMQIIKLYDDAMGDLHAMHGHGTECIRIRMPRHEFSHPFLDYAFEFQKINPSIEMVYTPWVSSDGVADIVSGKVDCSFIGHCTEQDKEPAATPDCISYVCFGSQEQCLWVDESHSLARTPSVAIEELEGLEFTIPANQKRRSWVSGIQGVIVKSGVNVSIRERYCDSLEDFIMNRIERDDVVLLDARLLTMPGAAVRADRTALRFNPPLMLTNFIAYRNNAGNQALDKFVSFLADKGSA